MIRVCGVCYKKSAQNVLVSGMDYTFVPVDVLLIPHPHTLFPPTLDNFGIQAGFPLLKCGDL